MISIDTATTGDNRDTGDGSGHGVGADARAVRELMGPGCIGVLPGAVLRLLAIHQLRELHQDRPLSEDGSDDGSALSHSEQ